MLRTIFLLVSICFWCFKAQSQSTAGEIYTMLQNNCSSSGCHNNNDKAGGLDLTGTGSNPGQEVYDNIWDVATKNSAAAELGYKILDPGNPYESTFFRKIAKDWTPAAHLEYVDGEPSMDHELSDSQIEQVRQWILYGAPIDGEVVEMDLIEEFYDDPTPYWAIDPAEPPAKPDPAEGFQIRMGPIFLGPGSATKDEETEVHAKWNVDLPETKEIYRLDAEIGSSHHFIIYKFNEGSSDQVDYGVRLPDHGDISLVNTYQDSRSVELPEGTAFRWEKGTILDLNSHIINFSKTEVMASDVYLNVYYQDEGIASQEMFSQLLVNPFFLIPNDGETHESEAEITLPQLGPYKVHIWQMSSHTHARGQSFDVWMRNEDGSKGDQVFSATNYNGVPVCEDIEYDYQHPPVRVFSPFMEVGKEGFIHKASWINTTDQWLGWGATSADEMMITMVMYTLGTSGITFPEASDCFNTVSNEDVMINATQAVKVYPNPLSSQQVLNLEFTGLEELQDWDFELYDGQGRLIMVQTGTARQAQIELTQAGRGLLFYQIKHKNGGMLQQGKLSILE